MNVEACSLRWGRYERCLLGVLGLSGFQDDADSFSRHFYVKGGEAAARVDDPQGGLFGGQTVQEDLAGWISMVGQLIRVGLAGSGEDQDPREHCAVVDL